MNRKSSISKASESDIVSLLNYQRENNKQNAIIIENQNLQLDIFREILNKLDKNTSIQFIEGTSDQKKSDRLQGIITDVPSPIDNRIQFKPERRRELINDFLKLSDIKALNENEIGRWICCTFQGFDKPKHRKIITPKIGFENLRYFIHCIYTKYDGENRNKLNLYREMLELTHLAENKTTNLIKHFADPKPKKYPRALEI